MIHSKYVAKIVKPDYWLKIEKKYNINPFISASWLNAFSDETKSPVHIVIYFNDILVGLISGLEIKSKYLIFKSISKRYYFFSGPYVVDNHCLTVTECIKSIWDLSLNQGVQKIKFNSYCFHTNFPLNDQCRFKKKIRSEFIIDLQCTVDQAWAKIKKSQRKRINKLEKMNTVFFESPISNSIKMLDQGFDCVKERKISKGYDIDYSPYYMDFLDDSAILNLLKNNTGHIYQIVCDGEILCSSFVIENIEYAYSIFFGSSKNGYELGASAAMKWELIKKYINKNMKSFNLGGLPNDSSLWGIRKYKESMGAEEKLCVGGISKRIQPVLLSFLFEIYNKAMSFR